MRRQEYARAWTDRQFEEMSWHDNHVHGLRLVEGENGAGELVLDLDYILEWVRCEADRCEFRILPVTLTFTEVSRLRIALDYASAAAALGPFSIDRLERRSERRERYEAQLWRIVANWPAGEISFEAKGFEQRGTGEPVLSRKMYLSAASRHRGT